MRQPLESARLKNMKTKIIMIATFAVLPAGAIAAPAVSGVAGAAKVVTTDDQTVNLGMAGSK